MRERSRPWGPANAFPGPATVLNKDCDAAIVSMVLAVAVAGLTVAGV